MICLLEKGEVNWLVSIASRRTTHIYTSDSCPAGLGGYRHKGVAWKFYIPLKLQAIASDDLLEHSVPNIATTPGNGYLFATDSSTSEGWVRKKQTPRKMETNLYKQPSG